MEINSKEEIGAKDAFNITNFCGGLV